MNVIAWLRRHLPPADDLAYLRVVLELVVFAAVLAVIVTARNPGRAVRDLVT